MDFLEATGRFRPCDSSEIFVEAGDGWYAFAWGCCFQFFEPEPHGQFSLAGGDPAIVQGIYSGRRMRVFGPIGQAYEADGGLYAVLFPLTVAVRYGDDAHDAWRSSRPKALAVCRDREEEGRVIRTPPRPLVLDLRR